MRALLIAASMIVGILHADAPNIPRLVRWANCHATVILLDTHPVTDSFFLVAPDDEIYLGIGMANTNVPQEYVDAIVLHEVGHCLQWEQGRWRTLTPLERELDADRQSANLMCARGQNGPYILHALMIWAKETMNYTGDEGHGTLAQRIAQSNKAPLCIPAPSQSPVMTP